MIRRKNKFFTFCFALIPGAGHMYLGFMKQGISLMSILCGTFFFAYILNLGPLLFFAPILWFYSFFDALNKNSLRDEDLSKLEDNYMFHMDFSSISNVLQGKFSKVIAAFFIIIGVSLLFSNFTSLLRYTVGWEAYMNISHYFDRIPQLVLAIFIIWLGIRLIQGKKVELFNQDQMQLQVESISSEAVQKESDSESAKEHEILDSTKDNTTIEDNTNENA